MNQRFSVQAKKKTTSKPKAIIRDQLFTLLLISIRVLINLRNFPGRMSSQPYDYYSQALMIIFGHFLLSLMLWA